MSCHNIVQSVSAIATTTSARTMQLVAAASNHAIEWEQIEIGFDGTSTTGAQVLVELLKGASGGTATAANPAELDSSQPETVQSTGNKDYSAEPSGGTVFRSQYVHPQGKYIFTPINKAEARIAGGSSISVRVTVSSAVNYAGRIVANE